ncbi:vacuolar membrane-associated protein iml1 [Serendipita sp. 399]|nr:vacuolar membrane-associated protein iml1 [Serendipita sp. 399]
MATSRRRSGTLLSQLNAQIAHQAVSIGGSIILQTSTHPNSANSYPNVLLNRDRWPGIQVGDVIQLRTQDMVEPCVFVIDESDPVGLPYNFQVSLSSDIAKCFDIHSGTEVTLTKIDPSKYTAEALEVFFRDQYLGRPDMWRLSSSLVGKCWHAEQKVQFVGSISATIKNIYRDSKSVKAAFVSPETKIVYRSLTAKCTIFIQLCRELWDFADDGERYYEKVVHSFLPALFKEWKKLGARHVITIVLISRVFYDASEVAYAAGPIRQDDDGRNYKDFYKVVTDIEIVEDWKPTLNSMKEALIAFQRDILLTHHYHQHQDGNDQVPKLVGNISYAHDGPILEALNLGLAPTETHYIDRSLSLTGSSTILVTPGKGHFRVSKKLLKLTTTRVLDQGFGLDIVALGKAPLHATPLFSFVASDAPPSAKEDNAGQFIDRSDDILWGNAEESTPGDFIDGRKVFYWQPFWIFLTFWDIQMDLPFREDRYIPRARMPQFELMGLLHYDLVSSIAIPALDTTSSDLSTSEAQDHFDQAVFSTVPTTATSPVSTSDNPFVSRNSISKISTAISSLNVPLGKHHALRRTPSATSMNNPNRPSKLSRTDSLDEEHVSRRSRPPSGQIDDQTRERLAAAISGTSPKNNRLVQMQAERRARNTSQNLSMTDASSSNLTRRVSASTRNKSPNQSRRNSTAQPPPRQRRDSSSTGQVEITEKEPIEEPVPRKAAEGGEKRLAGLQLPFGRFTGSWLLTPWRLNSQPSKEVPSLLLKSAVQADISSKKAPDPPPKPSVTQPLAINDHPKRPGRGKAVEDHNLAPGQRLSATRDSPMSTSPAETPVMGTSFRNSTGSGLGHQQLINPSATEVPVLKTQTALARRWEHIYTLPSLETDIKWKSIVSPGCLPLTTGYFPTKEELEKAYKMHFYEVTLGAEMSQSFLVKIQVHLGPVPEEKWGLAIMRVMVALRLAQGFQFVLLSPERARELGGFKNHSLPRGPSEILNNLEAPVYLSTSDQIHRLQYDPTGPSIRVERHLTSRILRNADDRSVSGGLAGRGQSPRPARDSSSPRDQVPKPVRRILSQDMVIDVDPQKKSDQAETAILHYDIMQNPGTAFHFQLHWVGTSAKFIDEMIQTWSRSIEWFGLRLVEAYVDQIMDITQTNVFQSCFPIRFSVPPPAVPADAGVPPDYFEGHLLRHLNYVLDICSSQYNPPNISVQYSYRSQEFRHSQYVHKSGLAFAQIREGVGFEWLTNRLATTRQVHYNSHSDSQERPNQIMDELNDFCLDKQKLSAFWDEALRELTKGAETATGAFRPSG